MASSSQDPNRIRLTGKVSKVGRVAYTPRGVPVIELTLAVPQKFLELENFGYFEIVAHGEEALSLQDALKIGKVITVEGSLWARRYKDQSQKWLRETKIVLKSFKED